MKMGYSYNRRARQEVRVDDSLRHELTECLEGVQEEVRHLGWLRTSLEALEGANQRAAEKLEELKRYLMKRDPQGEWVEEHFGPYTQKFVKEERILNNTEVQVLQSTVESAYAEAMRVQQELSRGLQNLESQWLTV